MRKSGLTGDEAYALLKHGKASGDTDALRKEFTEKKKTYIFSVNEKLNKKSEGENIIFRLSENNGLQIFYKK